MELMGVQVELPSNTPVMLLQEKADPGRQLSIFIGGPEAAAIAFHLEGVEAPRPLTHDLLGIVISELEHRLLRVVVTSLEDTTFFAELHLVSESDSAGAAPTVVSARPSDAVALAIRVDAPIYASEELLNEVGYTENSGEADPDEVVEEFREFIQNVSPDDFDS